MKIENRDIAIHTDLNLFEGETSMTEKMIIKKTLTAFECQRERSIDIYIRLIFSLVTNAY